MLGQSSRIRRREKGNFFPCNRFVIVAVSTVAFVVGGGCVLSYVMEDSPKKAEILPEQFTALMKRAVDELGITEENFLQLSALNEIKYDGKKWRQKNRNFIIMGALLLVTVLVPIMLNGLSHPSTINGYVLGGYFKLLGKELEKEECVFAQTEFAQDPFRPPVNCTECIGVTGIHRVTNLSHADFLEKYAFTMQPVLIKDGQNDWTAKEHFSFDFFREVYPQGSEALEKVSNDCQFFPYQTDFSGLDEMLNMSRERVEGKEEPWYVGWSNCDGKAANTLRKHYKFPYFLPPELDHSKTDWVFMGLPGYGANMHIDFVEALSWQAQVKGTKKWILEAAPECSGICIPKMEIIVEPGDIIVLDTNKWFHATLILGNETSIVIGSEYY